MIEKNTGLETLKDIRQMMERSSRFISLSGLSGIGAGICALTGAWFANDIIENNHAVTTRGGYINPGPDYGSNTIRQLMGYELFTIALYTLVSAIIVAFFFTWLKSKKSKLPLWGSASRRLAINFCIPLFAGGVFLLRMLALGDFALIAPGCLLFYGIALVNASKYTLGEVRYLGYGQIILGIINCWWLNSGLLLWTLGFGILHIIYGAVMWWKYEKNA